MVPKLAVWEVIAAVVLVVLLAPTAVNAWAEGVIEAHNEARARHGADPLTWSDDLSAASFDHASQCVWEHGSSGDGENLAATSELPSTDSRDDPVAQDALKQAVDMWMGEEPLYDYNNPEGGFAAGAGHFTQVIWKGSTELGCGFAACPDGISGSGMSGTFVVCRYSPPGNMMGSFGDNVGMPSAGRKLLR